MLSIRRYSLGRAFLHGMAILGMLFAAGVSASPAYAAPTNDNIGAAIGINLSPFAITITDVAYATTAGTDPVISCGASQHEDSVWFTFVPVNSGVVSINTLNSQYDTVLAVFTKDPLVAGALLEKGCNDNAVGVTSSLNLALRGGVRYYIEVVRKAGTTITLTADLRLSYSFAPKVVAWGEVLGRKWDANAPNLFTYTSGWMDYPVLGSLGGYIKVSNNVNGKATAYFDGGSFDLYYGIKPNSGNLNVYVDNVFQGSIGQNGPFAYPNFATFGPFSDGVHKLELVHAGGGTEVNFDYIVVYAFPDIIPPARILTLTATTSLTTGKIVLKWKAVGDDGNVGTATSYQLRYFVDPFVPNCPVDWPLGTPYASGLPAPALAGTNQQVSLTGFVPGVKYYFCIAALDEVGNMGIPSNTASAIPTAGIVYGTGTYDDKHPGWKYTGNWTLVSDPDARYNSLHISDKIGDTASFSFTGNQFVFTYRTSAIGGKMNVYIDGVFATTLNQYTFYPNGFYYTSPILTYGPHTVKFIHATAVRVTVDQIYVWKVTDGGPPDPITDLVAVPGVNDGQVVLTWTSTGDDPGNVGTADKYEIRYSPTPINNLVDWDYATEVGGFYPPVVAGGAVQTVTASGLTPGATYYFAVRSFDDAYYDVLSNTASSAVTYSGIYRPAGWYEDFHSGWQYSTAFPGWSTVPDPNATNGKFHRIANAPAGSFARFWFNAVRFKLIYIIGPGYSRLDVYVDGVKVGAINQDNTETVYNKYWVSPIFALGNHVVEFRVVGDKGNVDQIRILP